MHAESDRVIGQFTRARLHAQHNFSESLDCGFVAIEAIELQNFDRGRQRFAVRAS